MNTFMGEPITVEVGTGPLKIIGARSQELLAYLVFIHEEYTESRPFRTVAEIEKLEKSFYVLLASM